MANGVLCPAWMANGLNNNPTLSPVVAEGRSFTCSFLGFVICLVHACVHAEVNIQICTYKWRTEVNTFLYHYPFYLYFCSVCACDIVGRHEEGNFIEFVHFVHLNKVCDQSKPTKLGSKCLLPSGLFSLSQFYFIFIFWNRIWISCWTQSLPIQQN